jgi:hypothetical protein
MSEEEKAMHLLQAFKQVDKDMANTVPVPVSVLVNLIDEMRKIRKLCSRPDDGKDYMAFFDWIKTDIGKLKDEINLSLEFPIMIAEQYLPRDIQKQRRENRIKEQL